MARRSERSWTSMTNSSSVTHRCSSTPGRTLTTKCDVANSPAGTRTCSCADESDAQAGVMLDQRTGGAVGEQRGGVTVAKLLPVAVADAGRGDPGVAGYRVGDEVVDVAVDADLLASARRPGCGCGRTAGRVRTRTVPRPGSGPAGDGSRTSAAAACVRRRCAPPTARCGCRTCGSARTGSRAVLVDADRPPFLSPQPAVTAVLDHAVSQRRHRHSLLLPPGPVGVAASWSAVPDMTALAAGLAGAAAR